MSKLFNSSIIRMSNMVFIFSLVLLCILFFPQKAYGYIDPSTGSLALQVILGFLVSGLVAIKIFWNKILNWFKKLTRHQIKNE